MKYFIDRKGVRIAGPYASWQEAKDAKSGLPRGSLQIVGEHESRVFPMKVAANG